MLRDLLHHVSAARAISPVSGAADDTEVTSQVIDMQGYTGCLFVIATGSLADADATFTVLLEESDTNFSGENAVADADMIGATPEVTASFQFDDDNEVRVLDYIGTKRYVRLSITPANNAGAWLHSAVALKYGARHNSPGAGDTMTP